MPDGRLPRWARLLLRVCLRTWPAARRRSHGEPLLRTVSSLLEDEAGRGRAGFLGELAAEARSLVREGLAMRASALSAASSAALGDALLDVRLAVRSLLRSPAFTVVVVSLLGIAIGTNAAVFGLVRTTLLAPPPYAAPDDLVLVWQTVHGSEERIAVAAPDVALLRERARRLQSVAFHGGPVDGAVESRAGDGAEHVRMAEVSPDFFDVLGVRPLLGPGLGGEGAGGPGAEVAAPDVAAPDAATVVVLSHAAWQRVAGGDPGVVGRVILLNGVPVEVVGVMPPDFRLVLPPDAGIATDVDVWTPILVPLATLHRDERLLDQDSDNSGAVVARLAPGATAALAREEVRRIGRELAAEIPAYADRGMDARPLQEDASRHARPLMLTLLAGAIGLLVVACLDVAGLVAAREAGRSERLAIRMALGAGAGRVLRLVLAEGIVLVGLGLGAALVLARFAGGALSRLVPPSLLATAGAEDAVAIDPVTLGVAAAAALVAVLLAVLVPARRLVVRHLAGSSVRGSGDVARPLRTGRTEGARRALVVGQVALSVVLLLGAGLLLRTVRALHEVHPGFVARQALAFDVSLRVPDRYRSPADRAVLMKEIERRLAAMPGVSAVGWVGVLPLSGDRWTQPWGLPGQPVDAWAENRADFRVASSGWMEAVGARLVEGRGFTDREDLAEDERVVIVDETLARRIAPAGSALGALIGVPVDGAPVEARVVGVVESIRYESLEATGREAIYVPYRQEASREVSFVVRTRRGNDPRTLAPAVRAAVREVDPAVPVHGLRTLEDYVAGAVAPRGFALRLIGLFAALGLICSAIGLYGTVAFDVGRRTRELGIRMAVGATPGRTVGEVLGWGMRLAGAGLLVGAPLALAAARSLRSVVFGVGPADPTTWAAVIVTVAFVTALATLLPAWRASRLDPAEALRAD